MSRCQQPRASVLSLAATLIALSLAATACQRSLDGARCPCVSPGWTCCKSLNLCLSSDDQCPAPPDGAGGVTADAEPNRPDGHGGGGDGGSGALGGNGGGDGAAGALDGNSGGRGGADAGGGGLDGAGTGGQGGGGALDGGGSGGGDADGGADGPPVDPTPVPEICALDGWCWTHPRPTGESFAKVWASGAEDVWVVGSGGTILRRNAGAWSAPPPFSTTLASIGGSAEDDVWLGGDEGLWHWDGRAFTMMQPNSRSGERDVDAIWSGGPSDVWAVGYRVQHWDGLTWTLSNDLGLLASGSAVWGSGGGDVYVGTLGLLDTNQQMAHWNGLTWTKVDDFGADQIVGTGPRDVLALSPNHFRRWDGLSWSELTTMAPPIALFPAGPHLVGALDETLRLQWWDGSIWSPTSPMAAPAPAPARFSTLWAASPQDAWGAGPGGSVGHWDGQAWQAVWPRSPLTTDAVQRLTGTNAGDVWAAAGGTLLHWDGVSWQVALRPDAVGGGIADLWASGPDDLWLLGHDNLLHRWSNGAWTTPNVPLGGATTTEMRAITGTADDDVWILRGPQTLLHWNGSTWTGSPSSNQPVTAIWSAGRNNLWVGGQGLANWYEGGIIAPALPMAGTVTALGGSAPDDVWAAMGQNLLHYDGRTWSRSNVYNYAIVGIAASSKSSAWTILDTGNGRSEIWRWDGQNWVYGSGPVPMHAIWMARDGTAWLGGDGGALLRHP